jgi:hypothetical protein
METNDFQYQKIYLTQDTRRGTMETQEGAANFLVVMVTSFIVYYGNGCHGNSCCNILALHSGRILLNLATQPSYITGSCTGWMLLW